MCTITLDGYSYSEQTLLAQAESVLNAENSPEWQKAVYRFILQWLDSSPYIKVKTSGSTGAPKTIEVTKNAMCASAKLTQDYFGLKAGDRALLCLSADYIAGKMMIVRALVSGLDLILVEPSAQPLSQLAYQPIKFAAFVPMQLEASLMQADTAIRETCKRRLAAIDTVIIGGSPMRPALCEVLSELDCKVYATYGMTETLSHIAVKRIDKHYQTQPLQLLPGIAINKDARGCLVVDAPELGVNKLVTNDMVEIENTEHFTVLGRIDNVINTGSVKVFAEQIEQKIAPLFGKSRFFIFAESDDKLHQRVSLLIEGEPLREAQLSALERAIAQKVKPYERPKTIRFLSAFIETGSGKLDRLRSIEKLRLIH